MNSKKVPFKIQYIIFNLIMLGAIVLKFFSIEISVFGWLSEPFSVTGVQWFSLLTSPESDAARNMIGMSDQETVAQLFSALGILGIILFVVPFLFTLLGLILHIVSINKAKTSGFLAFFPGVALFSTLIELILWNVLLAAASEQAVGGAAKVSIYPALGCIIFMVFAFILLLEDIIVLSRGPKVNYEDSYEYDYSQNSYGNEEYEQKSYVEQQPAQQYDYPVQSAEASAEDETVYYEDELKATEEKEGLLICIRGEYKGSEINMKAGELIRIGRDPEVCQLVLSDPHVSRQHCEITYQVDGSYVITNMSKNGVKLHDGTDLPLNVPYTVYANTAFRLNEDSVFRLG